MAAVAAAEFEADAAAGDVEFVVDGKDFFGFDFVKLCQRADGFAGEVHIGVGLDEPHFAFGAGDAGDVAGEFFFMLPHGFPLPREFVEKPEAGVVAGVFVFAAGVAEAGDEFDGHGFFAFLSAALSAARRRRAVLGSIRRGR